MTRIAFAAGLRAGAALGVCVVVLAAIGLTPSMSWVPELPLVGGAILLPLFVFGLTGFPAGQRTQRIVGGVLAGAVAGVISGGVGGLSYVIFGKSLVNIAVGMLLGARRRRGGRGWGGAWSRPLRRRCRALGADPASRLELKPRF